MTARLLQPTAMLPTGRCHITLSTVKNPALCDAAFRENSLSTCNHCAAVDIVYLNSRCVAYTFRPSELDPHTENYQ